MRTWSDNAGASVGVSEFVSVTLCVGARVFVCVSAKVFLIVSVIDVRVLFSYVLVRTGDNSGVFSGVAVVGYLGSDVGVGGSVGVVAVVTLSVL